MGPPWNFPTPFEAHGVRDVDPRQAEGATKAHEASISDGPTGRRCRGARWRGL